MNALRKGCREIYNIGKDKRKVYFGKNKINEEIKRKIKKIATQSSSYECTKKRM